MRGSVWRRGAVALLLAVGAACGDPAAPETVAPPGYTVVSDAGDGFAVGVPSDWVRIPMTTDLEVFDRNVNRLRLENPRLASAIVVARVIAGSGGAMMAVRPDGKASVNLTVDETKEKDLAEVTRKVTAKLTTDGATGLVADRPQVAGGPGARLMFKFPVETDDGKVETDEIQYYALRSGKTYILTVMGADAEVAEAIAGTLRIR